MRRDIGWNLVPVVLLAGVGLGLNFAIGLWWSKDALGAFNQVTIAFFAFAVVGALGLQFAVLRAIAEDPDDPDRVAAVVVGALVPNVVLAAAATGAFVALHGAIGRLLDSERVATGILWAAPGLFCFAVNKVLLGIVNGLRRMRAFAVYTSLRYILIAVGLVIARAAELADDQLPVVWTFVEGSLLVVLVVELAVTVRLRRGLAGWTTWARMHLDYGVRGVTATLAFETTMKLDVWMLGVAMSDAQVGVYSMAAALYEGSMQLAVVLQTNVNPVLARALAEGRLDDVHALVRRTRRWFVPALIGLCALGAATYPVIIPWLMGHDYIGGALPFAIMMLGVAIASPYLPFAQTLLMAARPGWHTVYLLGVLAVAFGLNLALIRPLGLVGAATAAAASTVVSAGLLALIVRRLVGVRL